MVRKLGFHMLNTLRISNFLISRDKLINDIDFDEEITNQDLWLEANGDYVKMMIHKAEKYIRQTVDAYGDNFIPIVSFSGVKTQPLFPS